MTKCKRPNCPNKRGRGRRGYCDKHHSLSPHGYIDAAPVIAHLDALRAAGLSYGDIANITGVTRECLGKLGKWSDKSRVTYLTARKIMAVPVPMGIVDGNSNCVPNVGTRRRLQSLQAAGYSLDNLGAEFGVTPQAVSAWAKSDYVSAGTAYRVAEAFSRLQMTPGTARRAARWAELRGYPLPFQWDEDSIDDPNAVPLNPKSAKGGWLEDYFELKSFGKTDEHIAERLGLSYEALTTRLRRLRNGAKASASEEHQQVRESDEQMVRENWEGMEAV